MNKSPCSSRCGLAAPQAAAAAAGTSPSLKLHRRHCCLFKVRVLRRSVLYPGGRALGCDPAGTLPSGHARRYSSRRLSLASHREAGNPPGRPAAGSDPRRTLPLTLIGYLSNPDLLTKAAVSKLRLPGSGGRTDRGLPRASVTWRTCRWPNPGPAPGCAPTLTRDLEPEAQSDSG